MNDILSGNVDLFFEVIATAAPQVQSKHAFALLATGNVRSPLLPDVPTTSELGYPGLNLTSWTGLAAAAGTPAPIVELLNKEANVVLQSDKMTELLAHLGIRPVGGSPAKMAERIAEEAKLYKGIISSRQISVQ
jgi:tripartite-type tricarboxylate transporter receptor subunit TctC